MSDFFKVMGFLVVFCVISVLLVTISAVGGCFSETAAVVHQETNARAVLTKYSWFKDSAAALDAKRAGIDVMQADIDHTLEEYKGVPRAQWPRDERERVDQQRRELSGLKMSFNNLAAEYNANMAKIHYSFSNLGDAPKGAEVGKELPREYKPYLDH